MRRPLTQLRRGRRAVLVTVLIAFMAAGLAALAARPLLAADAPPGPPPVAAPMALEIPEDAFAGLAERFRRMAQRDEASKDWHRAMMRWEAVAAIEPQDRASRQRITAIRKLLKENAERHFALAKEALRKEQYAKAFREFLRTLSYDPDNSYALTMVKHELNAKSVNEYTVKRGDTLREIAESEYGDGELTFLVQYYNDIRNPRSLEVGQVLRMPVVAGVTLAEAPDRPGAPPAKPAARPKAVAKPEPKKAPAVVAKAEPAPPKPEPARAAPVVEEPSSREAGASIVADEVRQLPQAGNEYDSQEANSGAAQANRLLQAGRYEEAAAAAETVLDDDPINAQAREVFNAAYYEQGRKLRDRKQDVAAMQMLARVDPAYKDVGAILASVREGLSGQNAEVHYIAGVTAFLEEDLDGAIREWEQTLKLDPNHPQASKDLENARSLQAKLAAVK